ncbi:MAG: ACT domain-containing protein [Oscillospiraceae bacterium]|nr:ACT domain-containing protein [Oscillospiraceae bacterium]
MRAVITVIGRDTVGILAAVFTACAEQNINVLEVTQSVLQEMFVMMMMVDLSASNLPFADFAAGLEKTGAGRGLTIHCMHEDIFNAMHRI